MNQTLAMGEPSTEKSGEQPLFLARRDDSRNQKHANYPEVGDYWHEMYCPCGVVVGVTSSHVTLIQKTIEMPGHKWTWDLTAIEVVTREKFATKFCHSGEKMRHKYWCDVVPGSMRWVRDAVITECFGDRSDDAKTSDSE